ncbi:MAG: hypothetical protein NT107_09725, partial [Planctomycetota bacterium]|nr:hypothetical protein [Planctomycetota bacterium]
WRYTKAPLRVALHQGTPARGATPRHPCAWRYTKTPLRVALHQDTPARGAKQAGLGLQESELE